MEAGIILLAWLWWKNKITIANLKASYFLWIFLGLLSVETVAALVGQSPLTSFFGDLEEVNIKALENQIINIVRPNVDGPNVQAGSAGYCYATVDINGERLILERIYICTKSSSLLGFGFKATELHVEVRDLLSQGQLTSYMLKV